MTSQTFTHFLAQMQAAYIEAMYFTDSGEPDDNIQPALAELAAETRERVEKDCARFIQCNWMYLVEGKWSAEQAGHDFWLSRNGHGAGFFDDDKPRADTMQEYSERVGEVWAYTGDDGMVYLSGVPNTAEAVRAFTHLPEYSFYQNYIIGGKNDDG